METGIELKPLLPTLRQHFPANCQRLISYKALAVAVAASPDNAANISVGSVGSNQKTNN